MDNKLGIAYSIKRKNRKKMAKGGMANQSAASEQRPMPSERDNDSAMISRNSGNKAPSQDQWLDQPTVVQARKPSKTPLKHPKMVPQSVYSVRLRDEEDHLQESAKVNEGPQEQPPKRLDEEGANRQGPSVPALKMKMMARGGRVDMEPQDDAIELRERQDEANMQSRLDPSEDEGDEYAIERNEISPNRQGHQVRDMEAQHNSGRKPYAEGGHIQFDDALDYDEEMELNPAHGKFSKSGGMSQPQEEADMEHEDSIAASIMSKKEHQARLNSDSDEDEMVMMADGGILSHDSIYSDDSDQVDLSRNADEDANEEDQLSFNSLRKENYSESEGLRQMGSPRDSNLKGDDEESDSENKHDRVSRIMSKMNVRRQFKQR